MMGRDLLDKLESDSKTLRPSSLQATWKDLDTCRETTPETKYTPHCKTLSHVSTAFSSWHMRPAES